jgi:hypothetical protein
VNSAGRRSEIRATPFAADHLTTVSWLGVSYYHIVTSESSLCPARLETILQAPPLFLLVHQHRPSRHRCLRNALARFWRIEHDLPSYINTQRYAFQNRAHLPFCRDTRGLTGSRRSAVRDKSLIRSLRIEALVQSVESGCNNLPASNISGINCERIFDGLFLTTSQRV